MSFFDCLKVSLEEAVDIKNGVKTPASVTRYDIADVKAIREQLNVSQGEMAKALGTSIDTIKSWETKDATRPVWRQRCWRLSKLILLFSGNLQHIN